MANFYYVKSGGTANTSSDDGRVATTRSTGSFATKGAANYWDSILDAITATTAPVSGDLIMCSDAHAKIHTVSADIDRLLTPIWINMPLELAKLLVAVF